MKKRLRCEWGGGWTPQTSLWLRHWSLRSKGLILNSAWRLQRSFLCWLPVEVTYIGLRRRPPLVFQHGMQRIARWLIRRQESQLWQRNRATRLYKHVVTQKKTSKTKNVKFAPKMYIINFILFPVLIQTDIEQTFTVAKTAYELMLYIWWIVHQWHAIILSNKLLNLKNVEWPWRSLLIGREYMAFC